MRNRFFGVSGGQAVRARQAVFFCLMLLGVVIVAELLSASIFWIVQGHSYSRQDQLTRRAGILGDFAAVSESQAGFEAIVGGGAGTAAGREVIHPFLGFVFDPALNQLESRRARGELLVTRDGFFETTAQADRSSQAEVEIGIFGGSVAMMFCFQGEQALLEGLRALPAFRGKRLAIRCFALGGYKQPQQLLGLSYLLARDQQLDVVINIDGFNELALSYFDNYEHGVAPHYPRGWQQRVGTTLDPRLQGAIGHVIYLRRQRAALAQLAAGPWDRSVTFNLVWRLLDRRVASDLVDAQQTVQEFTPAERNFKSQGPFEQRVDRGEVLQEMAELWQKSSVQMHHLCAALGIPYLHVLQPNQYVADSKPMTEAERRVAIDDNSPYRWSITEGYPLLRAAGQELSQQGVQFLDASLLFSSVEEPLYVDNCCHFAEPGSRLLASQIVEALQAAAAEVSSRAFGTP